MSRRSLLLLTFFTFFAAASLSQSYFPPVVNYSSKDYGKNRNPENYCVVQDHRGVLYFGNSNGVIEYDGSTWRFIEVVPGAYVRSMGIDSTGTIYVGTYMDFGYLEPNEIGELKYVSLMDKVPEDDRYFSTIWSIHANKEHVYFQADESFFDYDLTTKEVTTVYPTDMSSFHLAFMVDGVLHLKARKIGIVKYVNNDLERLRGTEVMRDLGVFGLYQLQDDSLLIITQEIGLWKWKDNGIRQLPEQNEFSTNDLEIFGSSRLSNGDIVLTTFSNGMYIMNEKGEVTKELNRDKGLRSNDIKDLFEDKDNNLWLALGNGISKVNHYSPLSFFDERTGIDGNVQAIIRFNGNIYVGTSLGLFKKDLNERKSNQFFNTGVLKNQVWDFEVVNNTLYVATSDGVFKSTDGDGFVRVNDRPTNVITYNPENGHIITGGSTGIYVFNTSYVQLWSDEDEYSRFLSCEVDPKDPNTVWLGSRNAGAFRITVKEDDFVLDKYGFFDGLNDNQLVKPIVFQGDMIFGTTQGILSFIHEDDMIKDLPDSLKDDPDYYRGMFQTADFYDSTFSNTMLLIQQDEDRTWYCAEDKIGYYDLEAKEFRNRPFWGIDYGRVNSFYMEDNGVLWIGCADGLVRYTKNDQKDYHSPFYTLIRSVKANRDSVIFNGAYNMDGGPVQINQTDAFKVNLEYDYNDVRFNFAAPYFEDDHKPEYSYFLEGHDNRWSRWGKKTEANYTNLAEGDYCFKVKAKNIYGTVSEVAEFHFSVMPPWYRTTWAFLLYGLGFIIVFIVGFRLFSLRLKRRNQWLEGVVEERTKEIRDKNEVLKHQKQEIEDSINYAQRIQEAILPLEDEMKKWLPNSFVLFRPKDIVSGDFYWFTEKAGKLVLICADCTGHGVPGAFMSMIGSDRLNIIVGERKILNPGKILSELNKAIKKSLKQDGQEGSTRDGMDAAICTIDLKTNELQYAGANRPLWIVEGDDLTEIKATKVAVAGFTPDDQVYEDHVVQLKPGMKFYMTSDGYADQFGGDRGKKLKVKAMKKFILEVCTKDFEVQKDELEQHLVDWMSGYEQIDDVCVVGFEPIK